MNPLHLAWVISAVGALSFFSAGFFSGRGRRAALGAGELRGARLLASPGVRIEATPAQLLAPPLAIVAARPPSVPTLKDDRLRLEVVKEQEATIGELTGQVARVEDKARLLEAELDQTEGRARASAAALEQSQVEVRRLAAELERSEARARELEDEVARAGARSRGHEERLREAAALSGKLGRELEAVAGEATGHKRRAAELEQELDRRARDHAAVTADRDSLDGRLQRALAAAEVLREEKSVLQARIDELLERQVDAEALEVATAEARELRLEAATLRARLEEIEPLRLENAALRALRKENEDLVARVAHLADQLADQEARTWVERAPRSASATVPPRGQSHDRLDSIVRGVARSEGVRTATIADEQGFPIAGFGDEQDGLAAFAGFLWEVGSKARSLLPVGGVRRITLETEHGTTVSACPLASPNVRIILATLTVGPGLETSRMTQALSQAAGLFS